MLIVLNSLFFTTGWCMFFSRMEADSFAGPVGAAEKSKRGSTFSVCVGPLRPSSGGDFELWVADCTAAWRLFQQDAWPRDDWPTEARAEELTGWTSDRSNRGHSREAQKRRRTSAESRLKTVYSTVQKVTATFTQHFRNVFPALLRPGYWVYPVHWFNLIELLALLSCIEKLHFSYNYNSTVTS